VDFVEERPAGFVDTVEELVEKDLVRYKIGEPVELEQIHKMEPVAGHHTRAGTASMMVLKINYEKSRLVF
jgi:hypothetical protein